MTIRRPDERRATGSGDAGAGDAAVPIHALVERFGTARHPDRPPVHARPCGLADDTVEALGRLSTALETAEDARGHLYGFHRLTGHADLEVQGAVAALRAAGHGDVADAVAEVLIGRDVVPGSWTFQLVEAYDENYLRVFRAVERSAREALGAAAPHLAEAELKAREQGGEPIEPGNG